MEQRRPVRILHTGDIHLDSPFSRFTIEESEERRQRLRDSFSDLMALIREKNVDIALIAGDLFDSAYGTAATAALLAEEMAACPTCRFFIAPGNHDPYTPNSLYAAGRLPENVHIFESEALSSCRIPALNTVVWGWAFTKDRHEGTPLSGRTIEDQGSLNLICGHADVGVPLTRYAAISTADLSAFGAHYAAFAHRHGKTEPQKAGRCTWAYCGCLEGRSFDEPGIGGAYLITATPDENDYDLTIERLTLSRRQYAIATVDLTGVSGKGEVAQRIKTAITQYGYDRDTALRVIFTGATDPSLSVPQHADGKAFGLYYLELLDHTTPSYDTEALKHDLSVRGELYRSLLSQLTEGEPADRQTALRALRMGLAALEGNDISLL